MLKKSSLRANHKLSKWKWLKGLNLTPWKTNKPKNVIGHFQPWVRLDMGLLWPLLSFPSTWGVFSPYCCYIKLLRRAYYLSLSICLKPENLAPHKIPLVTFHKISKQGQYLHILEIDPYSSLPGLLSNWST